MTQTANVMVMYAKKQEGVLSGISHLTWIAPAGLPYVIVHVNDNMRIQAELTHAVWEICK